jgi:aminopeptidase YwaD
MTCIKFQLIIILFIGTHFCSLCQDVNYYKKTIDRLSDSSMHGRGYVLDGDQLAANYIASELKQKGLSKFKNSYFQKFKLPVNTFPGKTLVIAGSDTLIPGIDFHIAPGSIGISGSFKTVWINKALLDNKEAVDQFKTENFSNSFIVVDDEGMNSKEEKEAMKNLASNPFKAKGIILIQSTKLTWSVSKKLTNYTLLEIGRAALKTNFDSITLDIENKFLKKHKTQNVLGYVPGTSQPDSFIVFTAHYDHLGRMGKDTYFPGANDNASGTAFLLDLANYYTLNPQPYSILFIAFAAEEAGLVGSEYYANHPCFPLSKIKFLLNLDLMSNGNEGITVVNGSIFEEEFELLKQINDKHQLLPQINARGKAANSDHYHFSEKGVKAFFIYTLGGSKAYHDVHDTPDQLKHPKYAELFQLIIEFASQIK